MASAFTTPVTATLPTVVTATPAAITTTSAVLGATMTGNGGLGTTAYGFVYMLGTGMPTLSNYGFVYTLGGGMPTFSYFKGSSCISYLYDQVPASCSAVVANLTPGTTYTVRAFGVNSLGASYGDARTLITAGASPTAR